MGNGETIPLKQTASHSLKREKGRRGLKTRVDRNWVDRNWVDRNWVVEFAWKWRNIFPSPVKC
jgi:hypothetical protein